MGEELPEDSHESWRVHSGSTKGLPSGCKKSLGSLTGVRRSTYSIEERLGLGEMLMLGLKVDGRVASSSEARKSYE